MKTSRTFILVVTALFVGFVAARWCAAQSARQASDKKAKEDYAFGLHELESFVTYLQDAKQTNVLKRFNDYSNAKIASENYADIGVTLGILQRLRDGRTNQALELLEGKLSSDIIGFVGSYRELPISTREKVNLKVLQYARDYRAKVPFKHRYSEIDDGVAKAFKILDEQVKK